MDAEDLSQQNVLVGNFEDSDPGDYIENGFRKIDANFSQVYDMLQTLAANLDLTDTGWRYFSRGSTKYRIGAREDTEEFVLQQALTALGFNGIESVDFGVSGDYYQLFAYRFPEI